MSERAVPWQLTERQAQGQGDDCVACHMPRSAVDHIPHTAGTDHRIPRGAAGGIPASPREKPGNPSDIRARDYHWALMTQDERRDATRDVGVSLESIARIVRRSPPAGESCAGREALLLLEAAVRDRPDDLPARAINVGYALETQDRAEKPCASTKKFYAENPAAS